MRCKYCPAERRSAIYHNHIDATIVSARVSVDVLEDFVAEFLREVEEISSEREFDSGGLVKVEAGLSDATELDS
jgi:hypothetical protein